MQDKVKLPKEVAEALSRLCDGNEKQDIFNDLFHAGANTNFTWESKTVYEHFKFDMFRLAQALVNGYEVEQTPEDKVLERYKRYRAEQKFHAEKGQREMEQFWEGAASGIIDALDDLGIKIEGVNA